MPFVAKDVYTRTRNWTAQAGAVGLLTAAVQNALGTHPHGAAGIFSRYGKTITGFALTGAAFALTESLVANQREKDDALNPAVAGCAVGFLAGLKMHSFPVALASCAVLGGTMATFDYTGDLMGKPTSASSTFQGQASFFKPPRKPTSSDES